MTEKTGWPAPALMQDDHRGLFRWFASKADARLLVRESVGCNRAGMCSRSPACADTLCPGHPVNCTPLRSVNGGERVEDGTPLQYDRLDEPLTNPEQAKDWTARAVDFALALLVAGCLYGAGRAFLS